MDDRCNKDVELELLNQLNRFAHQLVVLTAREDEEGADEKGYNRVYHELEAFCLSQSRAGLEVPFMYELLGDMARDDAVAIKYYELGLSAVKDGDEPDASLLLAAGKAYRRLRNEPVANKMFARAQAIAVRQADTELLDDIQEAVNDSSGE